jgi:hypothetical protein
MSLNPSYDRYQITFENCSAVDWTAAERAITNWQPQSEVQSANGSVSPAFALIAEIASEGDESAGASPQVLSLQGRLQNLVLRGDGAHNPSESAVAVLRELLHTDLMRLRSWVGSHPEGIFNYDYRAQGHCTRFGEAMILWVEADPNDNICPLDCEYYTLKRLVSTGVLTEVAGLHTDHWQDGELVSAGNTLWTQ